MPAKSLETRVDANSLPTLEDFAAERDRRTLAASEHDTPEWRAAIRRNCRRIRTRLAALGAAGPYRSKPEEILDLNRILMAGRDRLAATKDRALAAAPIIEPVPAAAILAIKEPPASELHQASPAPDARPRATTAEIAEQIRQLRSGEQAGRAPG